MAKVKERTMHIVFLVAACMSILAVAMICLFMFANGVPAIRKIGFVNFIFGKTWMPGANKFSVPLGELGKHIPKVVRHTKGYNASAFFIFWVRYKSALPPFLVIFVSKKTSCQRIECGYDFIVITSGKNNVRYMHLCINIPKSMLKLAFRACIIFQFYSL